MNIWITMLEENACTRTPESTNVKWNHNPSRQNAGAGAFALTRLRRHSWDQSRQHLPSPLSASAPFCTKFPLPVSGAINATPKCHIANWNTATPNLCWLQKNRRKCNTHTHKHTLDLTIKCKSLQWKVNTMTLVLGVNSLIIKRGEIIHPVCDRRISYPIVVFFVWDFWYKIVSNSELSVKGSWVNLTAHYQTRSDATPAVSMWGYRHLSHLSGGLPGLAREHSTILRIYIYISVECGCPSHFGGAK